jgi:predicted acetyltransferase
MRKVGDHRKDWIVKAEIWDEIQKKHNILGMIDDRSQVVDFARRLGHKVYQVAPGEF